MTRIKTKRGESSTGWLSPSAWSQDSHHQKKRSPVQDLPTLRAAIFCSLRCAPLLSYCSSWRGRRLINCVICSPVAELSLIVMHSYRIIVLRCRWCTMRVIRYWLSSLFRISVPAPQALLNCSSSSLFADCGTAAGFIAECQATIFRVSPGNGRRLVISSAVPIADTISNSRRKH